ncbi:MULTISPECIES: hypothetical protein [unclassified Streptomyces]|uniref:hypothetical protein n=1 Tax=unclassified Streptomyces TaxID=2593676 RepID=UPI00117F27B9|nr:hypothetical protein [Streptomyces sp. CB01883]
MPSLKESVGNLPDDCPGWGIMFFEPMAEGMAVKGFALAADWPVWTQKQARAARLLCVECDYDLRQKGDEDRLPNIPLPQKPHKIRLVCGRCCNDGLDEMERLDALTGQPA